MRTSRLALLGTLTAIALAVEDSAASLEIRFDPSGDTLSVFREGASKPLLTQNARAGFRPYLHPIIAPDGNGILTEHQPGHHKHQTGLFWGFTRVNGRDYFHHPGKDHWRRVSARPGKAKRDSASWRTVYHLLDATAGPILEETQEWTIHDRGDHYLLDLTWKGKALKPVTVGKYPYGGLFLRMPWLEGSKGGVLNSQGHRGQEAEGKRASWLDLGMEIAGRQDHGRIALFDHPDNAGFPQAWRVDRQLGVGPVRSRAGDWSIAAGNTEVIRHRLVIYTGQPDPGRLTAQWREYSGQTRDHRLWKKAQQAGKRARFLTPGEAVEAMTVRAGYRVNVFAAEPVITQPMAFCWDDRGRMWIAENRDYESRGSGFSSSGDSRILILEDTDRDGTADRRKVFLEGIPFPAAIAVGFGGLWLGAPPNLLFIPDRDGDDVADADAMEVRLTGWGIRDRHETLNSFRWGPDGWLYGCQGFATPSLVGKPSGQGKVHRKGEPFPRDLKLDGPGTPINGGVWRYHPVKDRFEVVAHGFSNPWGLDFDATGQCFITACVIPHLWHVIPGGIYHRQGGRHFNPYVYSDIRTISDHPHQSAHGGARIYLSDAFPPGQHGRIFMANIHEHAILTDVLTRSGSGFIGSHGEDFLRANNAQWVGFSMEIGPAGNVYVLDWHDADICGKTVLNKDTGRVFRVAPEKSRAEDWKNRFADLRALPDHELAGLQLSPSAWHARRARVILQHRAAEGAIDPAVHKRMREILAGEDATGRKLRALWTLHVTGGLHGKQLLSLLGNEDEYLRAWAIQLLGEDHDLPGEAHARFRELAKSDGSPVVRLYLAASLQRMPPGKRWDLAAPLSRRGEDQEDHNIPKMIWFGLEPLVPIDPARALELAAKARIPDLWHWAARRASQADKRALDALVSALGKPGLDPSVQGAFLRAMRDGLKGRRNLDTPNSWPATARRLSADGDDSIKRLVIELSQLFGDTGAEQKMLATIRSRKAPPESRGNAIRQLAEQRSDALRTLLAALLDDPATRTMAIRAVAAYDDKRLADQLLKRYGGLSESDKLEALRALASRPASGWQLTEAIKSGAVPKKEVPAYVARQLRRVVGNGFVEVWGPIDLLPADKEKTLAKYKALLTESALRKATLGNGKMIYQRTCASCHRLHGEGGAVGPDLTGSNRSDLDYLLDNIINPGGVIQDDYKLRIITTRDGRTFAGNIANENDRQLTLRMVGQEAVIDKSTIQSREKVPVSMMPEGLLGTLTDEEVLDLVAYLRTKAAPE